MSRRGLGENMAKPTIRETAAEHNSVDLDEKRRASWLLSAYSDTQWTISSTGDVSDTSVIDFNYRLADGRDLPQAVRLYATVKEYAWWVRNPQYSKIDDARTHASMVRNLLHLAHALSIRNIWSFAHLQPFDLEELSEEVRFGVDAVLRAPERVEHYLSVLAERNKTNPKPYGGLPRYEDPETGKSANFISFDLVMNACNLPSTAKFSPRVSALLHVAAKENELDTISKQDRSAPPLRNVTIQSIQRWLDPLEQLYLMRRRVEAEAITFRPFPMGAARVASVKGVGTTRTPTPPPKLILFLLEHAARWIGDNSARLRPRGVRSCWMRLHAGY